MSVNDRRASYMSAPRPRVASSRAGDAEKAALRNGASPLQPDNMDQLRGSTSSQKSKVPREQNPTSEKRPVNTREKGQIRSRNPVKEAAGAGNRSDWERSRSKRASQTEGSPNVRKKEKEPAER